MQTAAAIRSFTAGTFDRIGARSGAVVAYLDGHKKHWNDARIVNTSATRADGVALAAIDLLQRRYGGDSAQVHTLGFSNGGRLVIRLIHEIPGALAGAAILSAPQPVPENFAPDAPQQQPLDCPHRTPPPIARGATASPPRP
ncbi:hypothetical protein [Amycolatopsis saalfeldensis]|uniref:Polyhydroxybutyrate depolymerase n=1 Tax=Amycolatopsis saalfeldensis TaxID=394193 RepID=A0A1H8YI30_9PSEU|nr:hypothetical protein [Amycolatopsis saalfeldensis]SEP51098.1 polyhydroxybutyrate depolymerase [Amycolatopsis saalfeldensis]